MNMITVRLRKRLTKGLAAGVTYTLSKSIDNASSIGGGGSVVAQNDRDLAAERGLSSFDQRHRFAGDCHYELPFGGDAVAETAAHRRRSSATGVEQRP